MLANWAEDSCSKACSHRTGRAAARAVKYRMHMHCLQGSFVAANLLPAEATDL